MCAESGDLDHDHERDRTSLTRQISARKPHDLAAMTTAMIPSGTTAPGKGSLTVAKPIGIVTPAWTREARAPLRFPDAAEALAGQYAAWIDQRADVRQRLQQRPRGRGGGRGGVVAVGALIGDRSGIVTARRDGHIACTRACRLTAKRSTGAAPSGRQFGP